MNTWQATASGRLVGAVAVLCVLGGCNCAGSEPCGGLPEEGEVCIPGGTFRMGHKPLPKPELGPHYTFMPRNDWIPVHKVFLDPYFMDVTEVTWGAYRECVESGICTTDFNLYSTEAAYEDPAFSRRPAYGIEYPRAQTYCLWRGKRLPTEAQWERAARGPRGYDYPWGDEFPSQALLDVQGVYSYGRVPGDADFDPDRHWPPEVGSNLEDVSAEGVHDLFTSVKEWVLDWYGPLYYEKSPRENPQGPDAPVYVRLQNMYGEGNFLGSQGHAGIRGSRWDRAGGKDWNQEEWGAPAWFRGSRSPQSVGGFRCVRSPDSLATGQSALQYRLIRWQPR